tara:strand:- start:24262 stop:24501 length:240 start_codon:yes stop_codon:yes gene_type:complete
MFKSNLKNSLDNVCTLIYGRSVEDHVGDDLPQAVMEFAYLMSKDYKMSRTKLPTDYKVIKTACEHYNKSGKLRTHYEVT